MITPNLSHCRLYLLPMVRKITGSISSYMGVVNGTVFEYVQEPGVPVGVYMGVGSIVFLYLFQQTLSTMVLKVSVCSD